MPVLLWVIIAMVAPAIGGKHSEERVSDVLDKMQEAVLGDDAGAYMAEVYSFDEIFVTEQRAWFADLTRNPVKDFRIEKKSELRPGFNYTLATMDLQFVWTLEADEIERSIQYQAVFKPMGVDLDGPWKFAGKQWMNGCLRDDNGLRVLADRQHKELAASVLEVVPGIQRSIENNLKLTLSEPLAIKIYPTVQELQYSIAPGYINMLSGWNEPGESIKILGRDSVSAERISSLLAHEIGHAVSFEFGPEITNAPWWSLEGISELVADEYRSASAESREISIAKQVARGDRRSWEQLSDFKGEAVNHSMYVYAQGWSMVRHITQRYGKRARNHWFAAMGHGASVQEATQKVLNVSFEDLDREWESEMIIIAEQAEETP